MTTENYDEATARFKALTKFPKKKGAERTKVAIENFITFIKDYIPEEDAKLYQMLNEIMANVNEFIDVYTDEWSEHLVAVAYDNMQMPYRMKYDIYYHEDIKHDVVHNRNGANSFAVVARAKRGIEELVFHTNLEELLRNENTLLQKYGIASACDPFGELRVRYNAYAVANNKELIPVIPARETSDLYAKET